MELDISSISAIIGLAAAGMGGTFALGKLFEKVNYLEKRIDKLENPSSDKKMDPLSILNDLYAKGKITREEYEKQKKKLNDN